MINFKRVLKYCKEDASLIENYEKALNDNENIYDIHHRLEIDLNVSQQYLVDNDLYYNRPASELIFLTHTEHLCLHNKHKQNHKQSDETRNKISESAKERYKDPKERQKTSEANKGKNKGKIPWNKGKKLPKKSEETRRRMQEAQIRRRKNEAAEQR